MANWLVYHKKEDFDAVAKACGISPVTARLIRNRDVIGIEDTREYLHGTLKDLPDPFLFHDMDRAVEILGDKISQHQKIRIIGDYDVDGICSSFILWRLFSFLGARVSCDLPDRRKDGYGINERLVQEAIRDGVDTIITCDNGIAAAEPLQMAKAAGLTVIVTDHHEIPHIDDRQTDFDGDGTQTERSPLSRRYILPPADVIIEPKLVDPGTGRTWYPFTEICGAEVVYKLASALLGMPDIAGDPKDDTTTEQTLMRELISFAAIATVCDVMPLSKENRIIVRCGLQEAKRTRNTGLKSLIMTTGLSDADLSCYHAGFILGPCLNASGRLDTAERALGLFMEEDGGRAMALAAELKGLNESRKAMTEQGIRDADAMIREEMQAHGTDRPVNRVLIIYLPNVHESIAGIIAGRIREKYERPTFVLTNAQEEGMLKGSGRSIDAYDMYGEMNRCSEYFEKFGGHKMAAGLSIRKEKLTAWKAAMNENCTLQDADMQETIHIDMELPPRFVSMQFAEELKVLEPCGTGNARALFVTRNLRLRVESVFGKNRNVIRLRAQDEQGMSFNFILFRREEDAKDLCDGETHDCNVVYYPEINEYSDRRSLQFIIRDYRILL